MLDHIPMLAHLENRSEVEEPVGPRLLEFYLTNYLHDTPAHVGIEEKRALRICCKSFKAFFDAAITSAGRDYDTYAYVFSSDNKLIGFTFNSSEYPPETFPFRSADGESMDMDIICRTFPSLKRISLWDHEKNPLLESLGELTSLTELSVHLEHAARSNLPTSFSRLTALRHLGLSSINPEMLDSLQHLTALKELRLRLTDVDSAFAFPEFIFSFNLLTSLSLTVNGKGDFSLPASIGNLKQLEELQLGLEPVESFPESLGDMCALKSFGLSNAKGLKRLPESFGNLTALKSSTLVDCPNLEVLPESIGNLKNLKYLTIMSCPKLSELPSSIGGLQSLTCLMLQHCSLLTTLPPSIGELKPSIIVALLSCVSLTSLPESIYNLTRLSISNCENLVTPTVETLLQKFGKGLSYESKDIKIERGIRIIEEEIEHSDPDSFSDDDSDADEEVDEEEGEDDN